MNHIMSGCCEAPKSERKKSQIEEQLDIMDGEIYRLSELADRLGSKLSPVTRLPEPCCANAASPPPSLVPVAETIRIMRERIVYVSERIDDLFLRVEL